MNGHDLYIKATVAGTSYDSDAQAFIDAVGTLPSSAQTAVNNLVLNLKSANLWTKLYAFYPIVGGDASSHKWNLKDPQDTDGAFRLDFFGGVSHTSSGMAGNASNAYADTHFNVNTNGLLDDMGIGLICKNNINDSGKIDFGCTDAVNIVQLGPRQGGSFVAAINQIVTNTTANSDSTGCFGINRTSSTSVSRYKTGIGTWINVASTTVSVAKPAYNIYLMAYNNAGTAQNFSNRTLNCIRIHTSLSQAEELIMQNISNVFNYELERGF